MSHRSYDTVIVGGGIIGLFTALELAKAGQSVCVLERGAMGQEASWAAGGILSPLRPWKYPEAVNALAQWSQLRYEALCMELQTLSGIDCEWRQGGMLLLDCPDSIQAQAWAKSHDVQLEALDSHELKRQFPNLSVHDRVAAADAWWLPQVAQLRNPRLLRALVKSLEHLGVELREDTVVESLNVAGSSVTSIVINAGVLHAGQVVIAAGAWSAALIPGEGRFSSLHPVKGQMLLYGPGSWQQATVVMQGDRYLVPRADGRLIVGSSVEDAGFNKSTDSQTQASLRNFAESLLPGLSDRQPERSWAGLRPASRDEIPVIGPHATIKGLFINTGHYRSGIVMAPAAARLLTDQLLGNKPILPVGAYQA